MPVLGAVARAKFTAATPVGPRAARARAVDDETVLPPPPEPPEPPDDPLPWPAEWEWWPGLMLFVGWPPDAVGTFSEYCDAPELPGGTYRPCLAAAGAAASASVTATKLIIRMERERVNAIITPKIRSAIP